MCRLARLCVAVVGAVVSASGLVFVSLQTFAVVEVLEARATLVERSS